MPIQESNLTHYSEIALFLCTRNKSFFLSMLNDTLFKAQLQRRRSRG